MSGWLPILTVDDVLAGQGVDPHHVSARLAPLRAAAERVLADAHRLLEPAVTLRRVAVDHLDDRGIELRGGGRLDSPLLATQLAGATEVVAVVCTVGGEISAEASTLMADDPVAGMACEGLACAAVDALAAEACRRERERAAAAGLRVTSPLSPGMSEWPLADGQRAIFGLVDAASIGVHLSASCQMQPTKSASFVLGVGRAVHEHDGSQCEHCTARDRCAWRAARGSSEGGQ